MYAQLVSGGMQILSAALNKPQVNTGEIFQRNYNATYGIEAGRYAAYREVGRLQRNLAAVHTDKVTSNLLVQKRQAEAEANAKVSAAAAGVQGGSVTAVIHQTEVNASLAAADNERRAEQSRENILAGIYEADLQGKSLKDYKDHFAKPQSTMSAVFKGLSKFSLDDYRDARELWQGTGKPTPSTYDAKNPVHGVNF